MKYIIYFLVCYAIAIVSMFISYTYLSGYIAGALIGYITGMFWKSVFEEGKR